MKKISFLYVVSFLLMAGAFIAGLVVVGCSEKKSKAIVVGCPIPRASAYGQNGERGLILAAEQINASGGINFNGERTPLRLEIVDTRDEEAGVPTSEVLLAIEKLILQKKVDIIVGGPCMSECGIAAMDLYARHNIIDLVSIGCYTPTWDKQKFASNPQKYRHSFRLSGSVAWYITEAIGLLSHIKQEFGFHRMYVMIEDSLMCRKAAEMIEQQAVSSGWTIVGRDKHPIAATDFSIALSECKAAGAQILFVWAYAPESSILLRQWADMQIPAIPFGFIGAAEDPAFWEATNGKCAHSVVALTEAGNVPTDVTPRAQQFYEAFKDRWSVPPRSSGCVSGYESLYVLKDAIERAGTLEHETLIQALEETRLPCVRGTIRFDENHQVINGYDPQASALGTWIQWQNGTRVGVWPPAAATGTIQVPPWIRK